MQHIQQHKLRQIDVERHIRTCDGENFKSTPFFCNKRQQNFKSHTSHILLKI